MYTFSRAERLGEKLSPRIREEDNFLYSLSQYVKILCNVVPIHSEYPLQNDLKVVIAAGLTSSHPEQSS